jgi:hypothetical protein
MKCGTSREHHSRPPHSHTTTPACGAFVVQNVWAISRAGGVEYALSQLFIYNLTAVNLIIDTRGVAFSQWPFCSHLYPHTCALPLMKDSTVFIGLANYYSKALYKKKQRLADASYIIPSI